MQTSYVQTWARHHRLASGLPKFQSIQVYYLIDSIVFDLKILATYLTSTWSVQTQDLCLGNLNLKFEALRHKSMTTGHHSSNSLHETDN